MATPIPTYLLTGMLGAGKTTLLNRILKEPEGNRFGVLVNEFGSIDVDGELVETTGGPQLSLANGCICCTIRDDFEQAVLDLVTRHPYLDYLLIEASGVADPKPVANTFILSENLRELIRLDSVIAVVDSEAFPTLRGEAAYLARRQVAAADLVLLNKSDLVSEEGLAEVLSSLERWVPRLRTFQSIHGQLPLELLLGQSRFEEGQLPEGPAVEVHVHGKDSSCHHDHDAPHFLLESWTYDQPGEFRPRALASILKTLPLGVYRAKGFVSLQGEDEPVFQVQLCGTRLDIRAASQNKKASGLVFLAEEGSVDFEDLERQLRQAAEPGQSLSKSEELFEHVQRLLKSNDPTRS